MIEVYYFIIMILMFYINFILCIIYPKYWLICLIYGISNILLFLIINDNVYYTYRIANTTYTYVNSSFNESIITTATNNYETIILTLPNYFNESCLLLIIFMLIRGIAIYKSEN